VTKWAVMVCLDKEEDDWIYITEQTEHCWDLKPMLFESIERAFEYADTWRLPGKEHNVQVVSYDEA
jgi:hypothetical protein